MSKALATKNVAAVLLGLSLILGFAFSFATPAKADTLSDLQTQVQALLAQIATLQGNSSTTTTTSGTCTTFTQNLSLGQSGGQVMAVQQFLNNHGFTVSTSGAGSPGNESSYFGAKTKAAIVAFQNAHASTVLTPVGLTAGTGYWGPSTRAAVNALCTSSTTTTTTTTGGTTTTSGPGITVSAATQPANSLAPGGTSRVPFTTFTLTNNTGAAVTVNGVTVQRTGLANDAVFTGVELVDQNGAQIGVSRTFDSNHQATIGDVFTLNAGQSVTYTVAGNMQTNMNNGQYAGQVASISVIGVNTSVPVSGSLPITGASQTINASLTTGSVTANLSTYDPNTNATKHIGDVGIKFSGVRFTAGSAEDVKFFSMRWRLNGSVSPSDLANLATVVSGTSYPTTLSADGRYLTSTFPGGILVQKGFSVDAYLQGDIVGTNASGRIAEFDVDKTADVYFVGQTYGYGITPTISATGGTCPDVTDQVHGTCLTATGQPWFQGSTVSVQGGTVTTIQNATSVASQNISINVPNQPLGGFQTNFAGEPVTVQGLKVNISSTGTSSVSELTSVSIVNSNGSVIAGPVDAVGSVLNFSNSVTFPVGVQTYTLEGKIPSTGWNNGATVQLNTTPSSWTSPQGQNSGNSVAITVPNFTMNTMTVRAATLTIAASPNPSAQSIVVGGQNILFANVQLDASQSGEDVRINQVPLNLTLATAGDAVNLNNCQLWNGSVAVNTGSNDKNTLAAGSNTFTFDNSLTVPKGTVVTLGLTCNLSSSSGTGGSHTYQFGTTGTGPQVSGAQSGTSFTATENGATNSGVMTASAGASVTVSSANSAVAQPALSLVAAGTTGITIGTIDLRSSNENFNLTKLGLTLVNGSYNTKSSGNGGTTNGGINDVTQVYIYNGSTQVGTVTFTGTTATATSSLSIPVTLTRDTDTYLTIKADIAGIGTSLPGGIGDILKVDPVNFEGTGISSGTTIRGSATAGVNGVQLYRSYPTVAFVSNSVNPNGTNVTLKRFTITANAAGSVGIYQMKFSVATSSATITDLKLYAYTDAGYSQGVASQGSGTGLIADVTPSGNIPVAATFTTSPNPVEIPAGTTYYFALLGTVTPGSGANNWTISPTLLGDSATTTGTVAGYNVTAAASVSTSDFVWSDNATTTSALVTNDWANGFQVPGLPSTGI